MSLMKRIERDRRDPPQNNFQDIKTLVQNRLLAELPPDLDISNTADVRLIIEELFNRILQEEGVIL